MTRWEKKTRFAYYDAFWLIAGKRKYPMKYKKRWENVPAVSVKATLQKQNEGDRRNSLQEQATFQAFVQKKTILLLKR